MRLCRAKTTRSSVKHAGYGITMGSLSCAGLLMTVPGHADVTVEVGTDVPLSVGVQARLEPIEQLRVCLGVGYLPGIYVDAINSVVEGFGGYGPDTADLIRSALQSSLIVHPSIGYRPFSNLGLYASGGYVLAALGGEATAGELIAGLTGQDVPEARLRAARTFSATAVVHAATVEIGYDFALPKHWTLRAAVGGLFTFASTTEITPDFEPRAQAAMDEFTSYGERYLDDVIVKYIHSPYLGVSSGYTF